MGEGMPFSFVLQLMLPLLQPAAHDCELPQLVNFTTYTIPSASMEPTLPKNSRAAAVCLAPNEAIQRGDVVTFHGSAAEGDVVFAKRVIGLPGDQITLHNGIVRLNGKDAVYAARSRAGGSSFGPRTEEALPDGNSHTILSGLRFVVAG